jgi:hypothetical protein
MSGLLNRLFNTNVILSGRLARDLLFEFDGREHSFEYEIAIEMGGGKKSRPCRIKVLTYLFVDGIITPLFLAKKDF